MVENMTGIHYYVEGVTLDIDLTPLWWGAGIEMLAVCVAASRVLTTSPLADPIASFEIGIDAIKARCPWDEEMTPAAVMDWRRSVLAAFDAMPEAQQRIESHLELEAERKAENEHRRKVRAELFGRPWRVHFADRAAVVYGCGHERALDPTQPATLDSEERCPTCAAA